MRPDTGTACGDKPLVKRGHRVRAFLENLCTVYGRVKGEQGLPGKHLPVWDRGLPPVPAAPSPRCLVPACVPSSLPQLALPPSLLVPRTGRGMGPSWHLCPPQQDPSSFLQHRLVAAGPHWWPQSWLVAPPAGTRLGCHSWAGQSRLPTTSTYRWQLALCEEGLLRLPCAPGGHQPA